MVKDIHAAHGSKFSHGFIKKAFPGTKKNQESDRHFGHKHVSLAISGGSLSALRTPTPPCCLEQRGHGGVSL